MGACSSIFWWGLAVAASLMPLPAFGQEDLSNERTDPISRVGREIHGGFVVLDGSYLPPPYRPERRGEDLLINGRMALPGWFATEGDFKPVGGPVGSGWGRGGFPGGRPGGFGGWAGGPFFPLARVERNLEEDALLLGGEKTQGRFVFSTDAYFAMDVLLSDASTEEKLAQLGELGIQSFDQAEWQPIVAAFRPSSDLAARIAPIVEEYRRIESENMAEHRSLKIAAFFSSRPVKYSVTLAAMGLLVAACGTLINYRPEGRARWSEVDTQGEGVPIVIRSVVLLVLLGLFDLACTLIAQQAGGFTELNPLGHRLAASPLLLTGFKLATLLVACGILYALRRYRGAQVAAWWMCLLLTVLTFRWLTYNSMFMS